MPRRSGLGLTLTFGHPAARPVLGGLLAAMVLLAVLGTLLQGAGLGVARGMTYPSNRNSISHCSGQTSPASSASRRTARQAASARRAP